MLLLSQPVRGAADTSPAPACDGKSVAVGSFEVSLTVDEEDRRFLLETPSQVQAIIQFSAEDEVGDSSEDTSGRDVYMGYGRINANDALALAASKRFLVLDSNGNHLASIDAEGNLSS